MARKPQDFVHRVLGLILCLAIGVFGLSGLGRGESLSSSEQEAYEQNRAGMANMSMARFGEAIAEFKKAAALHADYEIRGQPLVYTPIFMTAWAYEKLGDVNQACDNYRRFLEIAPPDEVEATKAEHAREVLDTHCR